MAGFGNTFKLKKPTGSGSSFFWSKPKKAKKPRKPKTKKRKKKKGR